MATAQGKQGNWMFGAFAKKCLKYLCKIFLPPAYVVRREVMFSLCPPFRGGVPTFPGGGGTYSQIWMEGGYLPSQVRVGGGTYLPRSGWGEGYLPSQVWVGGGGTYSGLDGGVPT